MSSKKIKKPKFAHESETISDPVTANVMEMIHQNPDVGSSITSFIEGEKKHSVEKCIVCQETRPVFHNSFKSKDSRIQLTMWKINKDGACSRCQKDRLKRRKSKVLKPAKFSGIQSIDIDMGPKGDLIRHNNMHFSPVPPYLQNLSMVEKAPVSYTHLTLPTILLV